MDKLFDNARYDGGADNRHCSFAFRPELPPDLQEDMAMIHRNMQMEARIIDDLLDITKLAQGKVQLHFEVVDVHTLLPQVLQQPG